MKGNRRILFFLCRPLERIVEPSRRPLIEIEHVFVTYPGTERHILNDFSLTLYEGEHAVIRGGNGAGKSTLLRLLRGEQWPDPGKTTVDLTGATGGGEDAGGGSNPGGGSDGDQGENPLG